MGATKKRRKTKHRGNAAGMVEARGKASSGRVVGPSISSQPRGPKPPQPPTWSKAMIKALLPVVILLPILLIFQKNATAATVGPLLVMAYAMYVPLSYWSDRFVYNRHLKQQGKR